MSALAIHGAKQEKTQDLSQAAQVKVVIEKAIQTLRPLIVGTVEQKGQVVKVWLEVSDFDALRALREWLSFYGKEITAEQYHEQLANGALEGVVVALLVFGMDTYTFRLSGIPSLWLLVRIAASYGLGDKLIKAKGL